MELKISLLALVLSLLVAVVVILVLIIICLYSTIIAKLLFPKYYYYSIIVLIELNITSSVGKNNDNTYIKARVTWEIIPPALQCTLRNHRWADMQEKQLTAMECMNS